jgi:hypothetical protein
MNWSDILVSSALTTTLIGLGTYFFKNWITTHIKESVAADYRKAFEQFKQRIAWDEKRKQQAAELAELLSLWVRGNFNQTGDPNLMRYELQKKYWESVFWLDAPVLRAINRAFTAAEPTMAYREALIAVRRLYLGAEDPISAEELVQWTPVQKGQDT